MIPFDVNHVRSNVSPMDRAEALEHDPMYIDWAFYNWGNVEAAPEQEPLKATLSLDVQEKKVYVTVTAVDTNGNEIPLPQGSFEWAAQQVKRTVEELLQYEGVTVQENLSKILSGEIK